MSDKDEKKLVSKEELVNTMGASEETVQKTKDYQFDKDNFDPETESLFKIQAFLTEVDGKEGICSTAEMHGNMDLIIDVLATSYMEQGQATEFLSKLLNVITIRRLEKTSGKSITELREIYEKGMETEGKVALDEEITSKMPYNNENGITEA